MELKEYLKLLRESKNLSLSMVQDKTGITDSRLSRIENGKISPSFDDLLLLLECYETDIFNMLYKLGYQEQKQNQGLLNVDKLNDFELAHLQEGIDFILLHKKEEYHK